MVTIKGNRGAFSKIVEKQNPYIQKRTLVVSKTCFISAEEELDTNTPQGLTVY